MPAGPTSTSSSDEESSSTTQSSTSHQNVANRCGSAQSTTSSEIRHAMRPSYRQGAARLEEGAGAVLGQPAGDDQPLDLARAFPDPLDPQLAGQPLGRVLPHVAAA